MLAFVGSVAGAWSKPLPVHADGWEIPGCPVNGPRLAARGEALAVVWYTGAGSGAGRVLAAFRDESGFGRPRAVDDGAPEGRVDAVLLADGSLVLSWLENEAGSGRWLVRRIEPDGEAGPSFAVAEVPSGRASGHLRLASDGGTVFCAWTDQDRRVVTARLR